MPFEIKITNNFFVLKRRGYFSIWNQNYKQLFCQIHLPIQFAKLWLPKQSRKPKIFSCWKKNDSVNKTESLISDFKTIQAVWLSKKNWKKLSGLSEDSFFEDLKKTFSPYNPIHSCVRDQVSKLQLFKIISLVILWNKIWNIHVPTSIP